MLSSINKKVVMDDAQQPVAVIISYQDWQAIETIVRNAEQKNQRHSHSASSEKRLPATSSPETLPSEALQAYAGCLQLTLDPLDYQREMRDAWL